MKYTIGQVVKKTGLSAHTLRFYEKEGLLPFVKKNESGLRIYTEKDLAWLTMIECLKQSGLTIREIAQYIQWYNAGDVTLAKRLALFKKRKELLEMELKKLQKNLSKITYKLHLYEFALANGGLANAENSDEIIKLRKELFEFPDDFEREN